MSSPQGNDVVVPRQGIASERRSPEKNSAARTVSSVGQDHREAKAGAGLQADDDIAGELGA
jgi:hypothetical protein